jgi:YVTN family beta-propeller protein
VSVIDLDTRKVVANVATGGGPWRAAVSPDGKTVVVSNSAEDSVSVIDADKLALRATIPVCKSPHDLVVLPDSNKAFVACTESNQVAALDLKETKLLAKLDVGKQPENLALKPDGGELFVSNRGSNNVSIIETATNEVGSTFMVGNEPTDVVVTADNSTAYVASAGADSVSVYAIDSGRLVCATRTALPNSRSLCELPTGRDPEALALSPNQNFLLAVSRDGTVSVIRTTKLPQGSKISGDRAVVTMVPTGVEPREIAVKAFVANPKK